MRYFFVAHDLKSASTGVGIFYCHFRFFLFQQNIICRSSWDISSWHVNLILQVHGWPNFFPPAAYVSWIVSIQLESLTYNSIPNNNKGRSVSVVWSVFFWFVRRFVRSIHSIRQVTKISFLANDPTAYLNRVWSEPRLHTYVSQTESHPNQNTI
jgi:hypothetical protein